jgi:hypothetical protein
MLSPHHQPLFDLFPDTPSTKKLRDAATRLLTHSGRYRTDCDDLAKAGKFTARGLAQERIAKLKAGVVSKMRQDRLLIDRTAQELKQRRATLKRPVLDRTDVVAALDRREIRDRVQSLPLSEQRKILFDKDCDSRILDAILDMPKVLSGIPDEIFHIVEAARLEQLFAPALREIEEMEAVVAEATAAAEVARNDQRSASGLEPRQFERAVESIERKISLPWLKRTKDIQGAESVIVVRPGARTHAEATPDQLASGVYYDGPDAFFAANGCKSPEEYFEVFGRPE